MKKWLQGKILNEEMVIEEDLNKEMVIEEDLNEEMITGGVFE